MFRDLKVICLILLSKAKTEAVFESSGTLLVGKCLLGVFVSGDDELHEGASKWFVTATSATRRSLSRLFVTLWIIYRSGCLKSECIYWWSKNIVWVTQNVIPKSCESNPKRPSLVTVCKSSASIVPSHRPCRHGFMKCLKWGWVKQKCAGQL